MSYEYQPKREARAGRIDGSARNVQHTADGRRVVGLTSSQRSMQEGEARRAAAAQTSLHRSMKERQQRVMLAKQDGSFASKQGTFNRNNRHQWMNDNGDIVHRSDRNPYRDGGQIGEAQPPPGGGGQQGGGGGGGGGDASGQKNTPGQPSQPPTDAAVPIPLLDPTPVRDASSPPVPPVAPKASPQRPPPPATGRVMDGDRDVTSEIVRGLGRDRKGQFYTGKPEPQAQAPQTSPLQTGGTGLMAGAEAPKTLQMSGERIFSQGMNPMQQSGSGPVSPALSNSFSIQAGSPSALLAGAEKNPALLKPAKPVQNAKI